MGEKIYKFGQLIEQRYKVISQIDSGGMGQLYRVVDSGRGDAELALKMVRVQAGGIPKTQLLKTFQREFRLLTQLLHPNLIEVHDYGITEGGDFYFTMEYVEGPNLAKAMTAMGVDQLVPTMVQISRALAYLHARDIIHGDLKPANVLLEGDQVRLVDFGLAQELHVQQGGIMYIAPFFSAPEMAQEGKIDGRADLYSLGAIAYTWVVGKLPDFILGTERLIAMQLKEALKERQDLPTGIGEVIKRLLAQDPGRRYATANEIIEALNHVTGSSYALETKETASSYALRARFVGREAEMAQLQGLWRLASQSQTQMVLIGGESGVGKTRLLEEFAVDVELMGGRVVWGYCQDEAMRAYRPWREILRVLLRYVETDKDQDLPRLGPILASMMPSLWDRSYMKGLTPPADLDPEDAKHRLNEAIIEVMQMAARIRPTLLVVEDAHWGDEASLALLQTLTHLSAQTALLVCVTYRSDEVDERHALIQLGLQRQQHILLDPLPPKESQALMCSMLGLDDLPGGLTERLLNTTGGNTYFVQELVRSMAEEGQVLRRTLSGWHVDHAAFQDVQLPETIHQVVWRRLGNLSEETLRVLCCAAVVGEQFWDGVLQEVSGFAQTEVQWALKEGLERDLIFEREETGIAGQREFVFAKPVVQQVGYESVENISSEVMHSKIASWLTARKPQEIDDHLELIAHHLERAGRIVDAADYFKRAGERAFGEHANAEAELLLGRALNLLPDDYLSERYAILITREKLFHAQGAREAQAQDLMVLEQLAESLDGTDPSVWMLRKFSYRAKVANLFSGYAEKIGDFPAAIAAAERAIELSKSVQDIDSEANGRQKLGTALWRQGHYNVASSQIERARSLAHAANSQQLAFHCLFDLGNIASLQGNPHVALDRYDQAINGFRELGNLQMEARALNNQSIPYLDIGNYIAVKSNLEQGLRICQNIGYRKGESDTLMNLNYSVTYLGEFERARNYGLQALKICREVENKLHEALTLYNLGNIYYMLGDYFQARDFANHSLSIAIDVESLRVQALNMDLLSKVSLKLGNFQVALEEGQRALHLIQKTGRNRHEPSIRVSVAQALFELNELKDADDAYQIAQTQWSESNQNHLIPEVLAGKAQVQLAQGNLEGAKEYVAEILDYLEDNDLAGTDEPFKIYLICCHVLRANQPQRFMDILNTAYQLLQEQATKISDKELRQSFLENVAVNREIVSEYVRISNGN